MNNIEKQISLNKPEKRKNVEQRWKTFLENTQDIFSKIWCATVGWGSGNVIFYFCMLLFSILFALLLLF